MLPTDTPSRADYLLAAAGLALLGGLVVGFVSEIPLQFAGAAGSMLAGIPLADGFVRPPRSD